jgi:hypothetical protein
VPVTASFRRLFRSTAPARPVATARIVVAAVALAKLVDLGPVLLVLARGDVMRIPCMAWVSDATVGMAWPPIGPSVYRTVAARRTCDVPLTVEPCPVTRGRGASPAGEDAQDVREVVGPDART